ncbi:hypothetical protein E0Z10_g7617 [Xylaria hypoxylon]|uniref:CFEM domain-containing protein n=1 Tax=Xylaria hypoxylon TaxID=37992 RepID=A0A4Z0YAB8_9PEZI|nr:hypothetical protein E0Z10_g7617 [Xylaria hypoxylon]
MKLFLVLGGVALVYAQADSTGYFPGEPSCAIPCLTSAIAAAGCQLSDIGCQCGPTQSVIANKVEGCIFTSCTDPAELGEAANAGLAICSSFLAGELSFTKPEEPAQTPTPVPGSSSNSGATNTSVILTNPPTPSATSTGSETSIGSGSVSVTSEGTHTDTLIGPSTPVLTGSLTGSLTSLPSSSPTTGAATRLGAGVLVGIMGAVVLF